MPHVAGLSAGRVVCIGMGKSGHIARKIAATLASTGTPAFYVHPGEAGHGDLGMITDRDVVLALSYSGESDEILTLLPVLKRQGNVLIAMTGRAQSTMAREAPMCTLTSAYPPKPVRWRWPRPPAPRPQSGDGRCAGGGPAGSAWLHLR